MAPFLCQELKDYFRAMFKAPTEEELDAFYVSSAAPATSAYWLSHPVLSLAGLTLALQDSYRGSDEEREELLRLYREFKGSMERVGAAAALPSCADISARPLHP